MPSSSPHYKASLLLKNILFQWKCEVSEPFPLSDARIWLKRYFIANYGDSHKVDDFLEFLQRNGFIKIAFYEKTDSPLYYPDDEFLSNDKDGHAMNPDPGISITEKVQLELYYRSLAINLLNGTVAHLSNRIRSELHPSLHYNLKVVKFVTQFPPIESCKYCADWLATCGKNIYINNLGIGHGVNVDLIAQLDYLTKCSRSRVLSKENKLSLVSYLVTSSIQILKESTGFSPPHRSTIRLFEFLLCRLDEVKSKADAFDLPYNLADNRLRSSQPDSSQEPTDHLVSRSNSASPKPFRRSKTLADFKSVSAGRRGVSLLPGKLVKSRSTIFNAVEMSEQALRLASTLLPPSICYTIAHLTSALNNIQCCEGEDISMQNFSPLSSPDYLSSLMAPILFPSDLEKAKTASNWMEILLRTLFSCPSQSAHPPELLRGLITFPIPPSPLKKTGEATDNNESEASSSINLHSALAQLSLEAPSSLSIDAATSGSIQVESMSENGRKSSKVAIELASELETRKGLMNLLNRILEDQSLDPKTKYGYLVLFKQNHSEIFWKRFRNEYTADAYMSRLVRKMGETIKTQGSVNPPSILRAINKLSWSKTSSKRTK